MLGYGYDTTGNIIYLHDTWDYSNHQMTWGGTYSGLQHRAVTVIRLQVTAPTVTNSTGASNIASTSATLNGELTSTGGVNPTVHIYWGDNNGGTTPGAWDNNVNLGVKGLGTFYTDISGLTPGSTYYYRCYASNSAGSDWADSTASFITPVKLVFTSNRDGNEEVYWMYANGTSQTRLTNTPEKEVGPALSPDGTKIAFTSWRDGNSEIYVMNADGSGQTRLTNDPAPDMWPAWSPDGTKIAFNSSRDGNAEIYVVLPEIFHFGAK
jgi:dipeptidyl aminopeptidase/acylaminoacyl peptidase